MNEILVKGLSYTYPNGRGVKNINLAVSSGQAIGFLGPNGAGKTSTIRAIMGFLKPDEGFVNINGMNAFSDAPEIMKNLGFIAGETAFPEFMTGDEYINFMIDARAEVLEKEKRAEAKKAMQTEAKRLVEVFDLNSKGKIKKMSKGMKQKVAIVCAFMHNPDVYILDEPTSGLDPLMQNRFDELLMQKKRDGKVIFISSHIFAETERICDRLAIIKDGVIVKEASLKELRIGAKKIFNIEADNVKDIKELFGSNYESKVINAGEIEFYVPADKIHDFVKKLTKADFNDITTKELSLEDAFISYYDTDKEGK
ncbi:MAG: ABC transporter ATP-binding protein [Christensenellaceae bacterium]|nr:ABC transporter ATP-binding protein [Christensenellaceae bacterium]